MYDVYYADGKWWIRKDKVILDILGCFDEPVSPSVIIEEIKDEV